jgi:hypothetical protein
MHDFYEAYWPVTLDLEKMPHTIRRVLSLDRATLPEVEPEHILHENGKSYYALEIDVISGLPPDFLSAYGILNANKIVRSGNDDFYRVYWPLELDGDSIPPEIFNIEARIYPTLE